MRWRFRGWDEEKELDEDQQILSTGDSILLEFQTLYNSVSETHSPQVRAVWDEYLLRLELLDGMDRSLKKRRMVDLYYEPVSERSLMKNQMTAWGCSLLSLTLFGVIFALVLGSAFDLPPLVMKLIRVLVFFPLFVFLAAQIFVWLARPSPTSSNSEFVRTNGSESTRDSEQNH